MNHYGLASAPTYIPHLHPAAVDQALNAIHVLPQREAHWFIGLFVVALGMVFMGYFVYKASTKELDPTQHVETMNISSQLQIGGSSQMQYLVFGTANVARSTEALPTQTQIIFPVAALKTPQVFLTLQQSGTFYTGLSFSASNVSKTGFTLVTDAIRHGTVANSDTVVTLDRVPEMTESLTVNWMAIA